MRCYKHLDLQHWCIEFFRPSSAHHAVSCSWLGSVRAGVCLFIGRLFLSPLTFSMQHIYIFLICEILSQLLVHRKDCRVPMNGTQCPWHPFLYGVWSFLHFRKPLIGAINGFGLHRSIQNWRRLCCTGRVVAWYMEIGT
jgi:hypothetical protein